MNGSGIVIGLVTGTLVGASAIGSGSLVIPLLLLLTPAPPGAAIGTSLALATGTKLVGYLAHRKLGNVNLELGKWLIVGALPGTAAATLVLAGLRNAALPADLARQLVGLLLVLPAILLLAAASRPHFLAALNRPPSKSRDRLKSTTETLSRSFQARERSGATKDFNERSRDKLQRVGANLGGRAALVGAAVSLVVTLTSVGSGGLLMLALLLWRPPPIQSRQTWVGELVGTATFYGLVAAVLGTLAHLALNNIDPVLLAQLAAGSVPGVLLGARLTRLIPESYYQAGIASLNLALGLRLALGT